MSARTDGNSRSSGLTLALCVLCAFAGCYSPPHPDCGFGCGPLGECPADYHCASDGRCHFNGTPDSLICADAAVPDTLPIDIPTYDTVDLTPPTVINRAPADGAMNVPVTTAIEVTFSEYVQNVDVTSFTVAAAAPIGGTITALGPALYEFIPTVSLPANATITVTLTTAITDTAGNPLAAPDVFTFQTAP